MKNLAIRPFVGTCLLLLVPLVMSIVDRDMPSGDGWHWDAPDFLVMGALLFSAGFGHEFFARKIANKTHRVALGITIFCAVFAIWVELAVGGISQLVRFVAGANS